MVSDPDNQREPVEQEVPLGLSHNSITSRHGMIDESSRSRGELAYDDPRASESGATVSQPNLENEIDRSMHESETHNPQQTAMALGGGASGHGPSPSRGWVATVPPILEVPFSEGKEGTRPWKLAFNGGESLEKSSAARVPHVTIQRDAATNDVACITEFSRQSSQSSTTDWEWITRSSRSHVSGISSVPSVSSDPPLDEEPRPGTTRPPALVSSSSRDSGMYRSFSDSASTSQPGSAAPPMLQSARSGSAKTMGTSHSAVTQWRCNRSGGDGVPQVVPFPSVTGPNAKHCSKDPTPPLPPQDIVATWERAIAVSLAAASSSSPVETPSSRMRSTTSAIAPATLPQPSGSLSRIMCRSIGAVQMIQDQPPPKAKASASMSSARSTDSNDDRYSDRERGREDFEEEHISGTLKEKQSRGIKQICLFLSIVSVVLAVTIAGCIIASRGAAPSDADTPSGSSTCSDSSASLSLMMRDLGKDGNETLRGRQDWFPAEYRDSSFGEFVAVSEDGSFLAISERLGNGTWVVHLQPSSTDSDRFPSLVLLEVRLTSIVLNRNGTAMAVGLATGVAEAYEEDALCKSRWHRLGSSIRPENHAPSESSSFVTTVSLSSDGRVLAMGLVTSSDVALYQMLRFQDGEWERMGPAIEFGDDDGSITHSSAKVALASTTSVTVGLSYVLATSRMFTYENHLFGVISVRRLSPDETSWSTVGPTIPFALAEASLSLSADGTTLAVSGASSTTVYSFQHNATSRDEWRVLGQNNLFPPASSMALAGSGRRLALAANQSVHVFELSPRSMESNGTVLDPIWKTIREIVVPEASAESLFRVDLDDDGRCLIVGKTIDSRGGQAMVLSL